MKPEHVIDALVLAWCKFVALGRSPEKCEEFRRLLCQLHLLVVEETDP